MIRPTCRAGGRQFLIGINWSRKTHPRTSDRKPAFARLTRIKHGLSMRHILDKQLLEAVMDRERIHITQHTPLGAVWFAGWLFTIGYLELDFWRGLLALIVWPYFMGSHFVHLG
jgi:hypothetical protein